MKKISLLIISCLCVFFFACNQDLKHSEAFVGNYTTDADVVGSVSYSFEETLENIEVDDTFRDISFSIILGDHDDEIVILYPDYDIEVKAFVTKNTFEIPETELKFYFSDPEIAGFIPSNYQSLLDAIYIPIIVSGNGKLIDVNTVEYNLVAKANLDILTVFTVKINLEAKGAATKN